MFELTHWNGLPPAGPRIATMTVSTPNGSVGPAPEAREEPYVKPVAGEIDSIVQADPEDKKGKPKQFREWKYECVLAIDEKDVHGKERPADAPAPEIFEQGTSRYRKTLEMQALLWRTLQDNVFWDE